MPINEYDIYINANSGSVESFGKKGLEKLIRNSNLQVNSLSILPAPDLFEKLTTLPENEDRPVIIGGGDGTITSFAELMLKKKKPRPFGILPLGTMNCLARDIDMPLELPEALATLAGPTQKLHMDVGIVNGEIFLCSACFGAIPESTLFREENRGVSMPLLFPRLTVNMLEGMEKMSKRTIKLEMDNAHEKIKLATLVVANNLYDHVEDWGIEGLKRSKLTEGKLGIYAACPQGTWEKIKLLLRLRIGGWQKDPVMKKWENTALQVHTKSEEELITLDGEVHTLKTPLTFSIQKSCLPLIIPGHVKG